MFYQQILIGFSIEIGDIMTAWTTISRENPAYNQVIIADEENDTEITIPLVTAEMLLLNDEREYIAWESLAEE